MIDTIAKHIGKWFNKAVIVSSITTLLLSGLMVCCQVGFAFSIPRSAKIKSCCDSSSGKLIKEDKGNICRCCSLAKNVAEQSKESIGTVRSLDDKTFYKSFFTVVNLVFNIRHYPSLVKTSQGPPLKYGSTPIYLQLSNLRL